MKARSDNGAYELVTPYESTVVDGEKMAAERLARALYGSGVVRVQGAPVHGWRVWRVIW